MQSSLKTFASILINSYEKTVQIENKVRRSANWRLKDDYFLLLLRL